MNNRYLLKIFLVLIGMTLPTKLYSHGEHIGFGLIIAPHLQYDFNKESAIYDIDANGIFIFLNGRVKYTFANEKGNILYLGAGLLNILQIQYGFPNNNSSKKICIRSDIVLFNEGSPGFSYWSDKYWIFREGMVLSINIEKNIENSKGWSTGIGLGVYL